MFKKLITISLLLIVGLVAISSASAFFGFGEGDLVEVIDVGIYDDYSGGPFGGAIESSIAEREDSAELGVSGSSTPDYDINLGMMVDITAKENIEDINEFTLSNVEVTYQDGSVQKLENISYYVSGDLFKDDNVSLPFEFKLDQSLWDESIKLKDFYGNSHVKGDIYVNTDSDTDKLIGHIDNDVTETA